MKMVRSLLLGSAAGFVAVAGAQAADMPVKAKPVEYVKICSLYGAGFYYLPGTDICIKWGAYVRFQVYEGAGSSPSNGPFIGASGQGTVFLNTPNDLVARSRNIFTMDARTQTEYGTLRAYILLGFSQDWPSNQSSANGAGATLYATRGFIQFAGFTVGKATSFYDIWSVPANSYFAVWSSDTGDAGMLLAGYTFQFGNGFSATIAAEDPRKNTVVNTSIASIGTIAAAQPVPFAGAVNPFTVGATANADQAQVRWPDVVANLRVDQAWGSFQVMGAVHDNTGGYFVPSVGVTCNVGALGGTLTGQLACGHPDDNIGFAVGAGGIFKVPMWTGLTDIASFQVNYTNGASRYAVFTPTGAGSPNFFGTTGLLACPSPGTPANSGVNGLNTPTCLGQIGIGYWTDGIYANPGALPFYNGNVQNTTVWGVNAAWDHLWTPNLKSSVYGSFISVEYNQTAADLIAIATCGIAGTAANTLTRMTNVAKGGVCNPDFQVWQVGSRTQWNITSSFYVGFDVMWQHLDTAFAGAAFYTAATNLPRPSGNYEITNQDTVSFTARAHWDILP